LDGAFLLSEGEERGGGKTLGSFGLEEGKKKKSSRADGKKGNSLLSLAKKKGR